MKSKEKVFGIGITILSLLIIGITLIAYCLSNLINFKYFFNSDEYLFHTDKLGHFGDFIGGFLGTILTAIATYFVYKTYISQKEELISQKDELILQRNLISQQQFENTFFNMLNVHRELKNSLKYSKTYLGASSTFERFGLDVIKMVNESFSSHYQTINKTYSGENTMYSQTDEIKKNKLKFENDDFSLELSKINLSYKILFHDYQNFISHYCRNIYHILKYIRENEENKTLGNDLKKYKNYANIFQSQLNVDEQFLLFYNFLYFNLEENNIYSTINLVNHYSFLENIGIENIINKKHELYYDFIIKGSNRTI